MQSKKEKIEENTIENSEFNIVYDMYQETLGNNGETNLKITKKNCKRKWWVSDLAFITDVREIPTKTGKPYKNQCEVYTKAEQKWITIEGRYYNIKKLLKLERKKIKGFYGS